MKSSRVVIVGGGFGGLAAAREFRNAHVSVTLIDRGNHHLFQPLLYQVATASLSSNEIAYPIRSILKHQANTEVVMAEVDTIDAPQKRVVCHDREIEYDYLILATGARHSYFGHPEWEEHAPGLKTLDDAIEIRHRVLHAFEKAEIEKDPRKQKELLTFVIVGAGPTGVELAGALGELACNVLRRDYRHIDPRSARILLVEAGPRVLPGLPAKLSTQAESSLGKFCVEVRTNAAVTSIERDAIVVGDETIRTETVVWAAGVEASSLGRSLDSDSDRSGRVLTEPDLSLSGRPEVFVVGDMSSFMHQTESPLPGLAPVAVQQGRHAARNVIRQCQGEASRPFRYVDRGTMATIGRGEAVADIRGMKLWGAPAWLAWAFVHIFQLIGFRNRFVVLFEWAWTYITNMRSARLITSIKKRVK
jgi:NADH:quinone reductase (non-electrogenic)